ncbi:arsenate reductase [Nocardia sp. GAS34]|jgi:arsenate reductase
MSPKRLQHLGGHACQNPRVAPAQAIDPAVVEAMAELGIDITAQTPKILAPDTVHTSDVVITMGCGDVCPYSRAWTTATGSWKTSQAKGVDAVRPIRGQGRAREQPGSRWPTS